MLKVLFAASELTPIAKVGGLGDVAGALPKALKKLDIDIRVVIPKYKPILTPKSLPDSQVPVYYVESKEYFDRDQIYGYEDDAHRFAYFSKAIFDLTKKLDFQPDVIHVNDYHTGMVPDILKVEYKDDPFFSKAKTLLTIHNLANQGIHDLNILPEIGLRGDSTPNLGEDTRDGDVDFLLQGVSEADLIVAVSPTYAREILTDEYGEGLQVKLRERQDHLVGVLNGIDVEVYNPATDPNIARNYSKQSLGGKEASKSKLVKDFKLDNPDWPVVGMVSRLVSQKGYDLILEIGSQIGRLPLNFVVLGIGEKKFEDGLNDLASRYPNIKLDLEFNEAKSRQIYAGSDFFLVPSRFEPCGLTQMIAMRYGAIPIVRKTGGLADTVQDMKTGVVFEKYSSEALLESFKRAVKLYQNKRELGEIQLSGMSRDFSWDKSAKEYAKLYRELVKTSHES